MIQNQADSMAARAKILVVDDEEIARDNLKHILTRPGWTVTAVASGADALQAMENQVFDVVLTDLKMKGVDGLQVLERTRHAHPSTEVIVITGHGSIPSAIDAMKKGAYHYISKPLKIDEVRITVEKALEKTRLHTELRALKDEYATMVEMPFIVGKSPQIQNIMDLVRQIAPTDCSVLLTGETGTGKELVARAIHSYSRRAHGRFMAFNCAAFNEDLLVNELFGHEKGAYTGAGARKTGLLEATSGGTIFLDEIGEMPLSMQVKLLRVIQEKKLLRLGGIKDVSIDIRIVAATNRDLKSAVETGGFRKDLYFRLNVVEINMPRLAERKDDIPLLATYFLQKFARLHGKAIDSFTDEAMAALKAFTYEGNVRELENVIERAVALSASGAIRLKDLPDTFQSFGPRPVMSDTPNGPLSLEDMEKEHIRTVLASVGGNKTRAAGILNIPRVSLWRKLKRFGLDDLY